MLLLKLIAKEMMEDWGQQGGGQGEGKARERNPATSSDLGVGLLLVVVSVVAPSRGAGRV